MLLLDATSLDVRRAAARGALAPLAHSLASDLDKVMSRPLFIPPEKAKLTRIGGRCAKDGTVLTFNPFEPHEHECPRCHTRYREAEHHRWWIMSYQLWLAERAVHAATLHALLGDPRHRVFAEQILERYSASYASYPNSDNVLGPSRLFFSTYLESIWLLEISVALDLLELASGATSLTKTLRSTIIEPASELIAGYDEGDSNRQVWNNAALLAAARLLGEHERIDAIVNGYHGVAGHLDRALLRDGTWYEGENYHQFAHRGLWYGVTLAERAGVSLSSESMARFQEGFATPFLSALPDFTFPARRDSPHRVSLRQWRYAESCELGLARAEDDRLIGALHTLYGDDLPPGDTGRARSAGESERNEPPIRLGRADLGWRSLLHARPTPPELRPVSAGSVLLEGQGLAVFRRDRGRLYAALDYGHSGGGHGHPDRLNLLLIDGEQRWLDDPGTGSYVDPTLMWYRSSLAHNAPLISGRTQLRVGGILLAHEERGAAGWASAEVPGIAPHSRCMRSVVVMPDYAIDVIEWETGVGGFLDLPLHTDGEMRDGNDWEPVNVDDLRIDDAGTSFVQSAERTTASARPLALIARDGERTMDVWVLTKDDVEIFRLIAPGPPGEGDKRFFLLRVKSPKGKVTIAWSPRRVVRAVNEDTSITVQLVDGSTHEHRRDRDAWHVEFHAGGARSSIDLHGTRLHARRPTPSGVAPASIKAEKGGPLQLRVSGKRRDTGWHLDSSDRERRHVSVFELGEANYRRTEQAWADAGAPTATVILSAANDEVDVEIDVRKQDPVFAPKREWNALDNERADINSDGVQIYLTLPRAHMTGGWLMVPEPEGRVRVTDLAPSDTPIRYRAEWRSTPRGYAIRMSARVGAAALEPGSVLLCDVMINEISGDRERRRGQLVLSGGNGEFIYLQGDRPRGSWVTLRLVHD